jgi:hypothetical protein
MMAVSWLELSVSVMSSFREYLWLPGDSVEPLVTLVTPGRIDSCSWTISEIIDQAQAV